MGTVGNAEVSRPDLLNETVCDLNIHPETGAEIVPGECLKMKLPAIGPDTSIKKVINDLDDRLDKVLNNGWEKEKGNLENGFSRKDKILPDIRSKGPKMKTSFVEPTAQPRRQSTEKHYSEENALVAL